MLEVYIANQKGQIEHLVKAEVQSMAWRLNGTDQANLRVSTVGLSSVALQVGNRVVITNDLNLPTWAGVIEPPIKHGSRIATLQLRGIDWLYKYRTTRTITGWDSASVGGIFENLINFVETRNYVGVSVDSSHMWYGGHLYSERYNLAKVYSIIYNNLLSKEPCEVKFWGRKDGSAIEYQGVLMEQIGTDKSASVILTDDLHLQGPQVSEQGDLVNYVVVYGSGSNWAERPVASAIDAASASKYGRRSMRVSTNLTEEAQLTRVARQNVHTRSRPIVRIDATTTADTASRFTIGDTVTVQIQRQSYTINGEFRVLAYEWSPSGIRCIFQQSNRADPDDITTSVGDYLM